MERTTVGSLAAKEHLELHRLSEETPSLEDFYLSIADRSPPTWCAAQHARHG
ncbi:hypothetical protein [Streptomyces marianii]|uniref:hypothetical protein n=1 Tax=Streptomyces marianii TaxID=1817406 RepID=UPI001485F7EF|nr:hypothetical protein [Streptomyces marianii]